MLLVKAYFVWRLFDNFHTSLSFTNFREVSSFIVAVLYDCFL